MCDEVFGVENFLSEIIVRANSRGQTYNQIAKTHEYILIYCKDEQGELNEIEKSETSNDLNLDDNIGKFNIRELRNRNPKFTKSNRPNLAYDVFIDPNSKDINNFCSVSLIYSSSFNIKLEPLNSKNQSSVWRWGKNKFTENNSRALNEANIFAKQKFDGGWNIYEKHRKLTYKAKSIWDETGVRTEQGTKDFRTLFQGSYFDHPKSCEFIRKVVALGSERNQIVLDFFAGSGTTAEA